MSIAVYLSVSVHALWAAPARTRLAAPPALPAAARRRHLTLVPTLDGGLAAVVPVAEADYRLLASVGTVLAYCTPHAGGGNPRLGRAWRHVGGAARTDAKTQASRATLLDGPLLGRFSAARSAPAQEALAEAAGSTADRVLSALRTLDLEATVI